MNTFGLKRPLNSFDLGKPGVMFAAAWQEIIRFTLFVRHLVGFDLER